MVEREYTLQPDRLRELMESAGLTARALSEASGLSLASINNYMRGQSNPNLNALCIIADFFAVPIDYLVGRLSKEEYDAIISDYPAHFMELRRAPWERYLVGRRDSTDCRFATDRYESPWPYNLLDDITGGWKEPATEEEIHGLELAMSSLPERESEVVYLYYREGNTLEKVGRLLGVSRERVRQILLRAVRKLRHPSRFFLIRREPFKSAVYDKDVISNFVMGRFVNKGAETDD